MQTYLVILYNVVLQGGERRNFILCVIYTFLVVTIKGWLKSVHIYTDYRVNKMGRLPDFMDHPVIADYSVSSNRSPRLVLDPQAEL